MQVWVWPLVLFLGGANVQFKEGLATAYWPGDGHCGPTRADGKKFTAKDDHIAHRYLPLGTTGYLCNARTRRCVKTSVRDRGPFGAIRPCVLPLEVQSGYRVRKIRWRGKCWYWQVQTRLKKGWKFRGEFDVTRPVAKAVGLRAFDRVVFIYKRKRRWRKKQRRNGSRKRSRYNLSLKSSATKAKTRLVSRSRRSPGDQSSPRSLNELLASAGLWSPLSWFWTPKEIENGLRSLRR